MDESLKLVGEIVAYGGGGAAVAFLIFRFLGQSWIENKFEQRLEQLRHSQALDLQRLKVEIDSTLSGVIRLQEKEFETLPEAWLKLDSAYGSVVSLVNPIQEYPDLNRYTPAELEEFLDDSTLKESQKVQIRESADKTTKYQELVFWYRLSDVQESVRDFHNFVARNSVFFPPELRESFNWISNKLWGALVSKEIGHNARDWEMQDKGWDAIKKEVEPTKNEIEQEIYNRLQSQGLDA